MNSKTLLIVFSPFFLMACNGIMVEQPSVVTNEVVAMQEIQCGAEPKADKIHLRKVEPWAIQDRVEIWWVGFTPKHYENMGLNFNDMLIHLKQRKAQIEWFRECLGNFNRRARNFKTGGKPVEEETDGEETEEEIESITDDSEGTDG